MRRWTRAHHLLAALVVATVVPVACSSTSATNGSADPARSTLATAALPAGARPSTGCAAPSTATSTATATPSTTSGSGDDGGPETLTVGGVERTFDVTLPTDLPADQPAPVVLAFHGFGSDRASFSRLTDLPARGSAAGSIVVVADGHGRPETWDVSGKGADAAFVDALLDDLGARRCIDLARVYATGFSAGAAFTIAYGCAHQDRIAAIATVAVDFQLGCTKGESILAFHGTADPAVPYQDGAVGASLPGVHVRGTELNMGDWAALAGCATSPTPTTIGSEVVQSSWEGCADGHEVVLDTIEGGGHTWPGADPTSGLGLTTQQVSATDQALAFFGHHHL